MDGLSSRVARMYFREKMNTNEISRAIGCHESVVDRHLAIIVNATYAVKHKRSAAVRKGRTKPWYVLPPFAH